MDGLIQKLFTYTWSLENIKNIKTKKRILLEIHMEQILIFLDTSLCGLAAVFHCFRIYTSDHNIYYPIEFFRTKINSATLRSFLICCHAFHVFCIGYILMANTFLVMYIVNHTKNQLAIISDYLKNA